ncbi:hypothetical protein [Calothrix sp. UHCC 0171]|uniref:hypothetical protein n=1 Tax=Calothrix sp. UHCC 0171 TaxID=3110245 RepID=UPI002B21B373|nr:hypothetical protein [Calothrix sp. UHCC 0171]MEA5574432.1 hypothetical protein [Calothrix sp. UHCC 0171]
MRNFFGKSGFMPAFFTSAFSVAGLFYDQIQQEEGFTEIRDYRYAIAPFTRWI